MKNELRQDRYKKIEDLERVFREMEQLLADPEKRAIERFSRPLKPVFLIVGCARSGSTLLYQYLASTGLFAYPTNLMSRFYFAPYIGARIQQMLLDFDRNGEVFSGAAKGDFVSDLGNTFGPSEPHEFWYFWDRFFKFGDIQKLSDENLRAVDTTIFLKELAAVEYVFQKPLIMKAMKMNWHIPFLAALSDNIYFIYLKRNVLYNAQSLLIARQKYFGIYDEWYSFKPPNYDSIKGKPHYAQVVDQVYANNDAIEQGLREVPSNRWVQVDYEEFCASPESTLKRVANVGGLSWAGGQTFTGKFVTGNKRKIDEDLWAKLYDYQAKGK